LKEKKGRRGGKKKERKKKEMDVKLPQKLSASK
jgi:hypothetical protein